MAKAKLHKSEAYLRLMFITKNKTIDEIAEELGLSHNTIRQALKEKGLLR